MKLSASDVANIVGGVVDGDKKSTITKLSKIENGDTNSLSFLGNPKYNEYLYSSNASIIIVEKNLEAKKKVNATLIRVEDPHIAFSKLLEYFDNQKDKAIGFAKSAEINKESSIGNDTYIGPFSVIESGVNFGEKTRIGSSVYIGKNVAIGKNSKIYSNVSIYENSVLGDNCIIHSGTVVGSDGFGFNKDSHGNNLKVIHSGNVHIGDNVEIGSNCTIDRATLGSTTIMNGVKIDNLVHVGHNVQIGKGCLITAQVGIAGSTKLGDNSQMGGQAGVVPHVEIGPNSIIAAKSGVTKSLIGNQMYGGYPARPIRDQHKRDAVHREVSLLKKKVKQLIQGSERY